MKLERWNEAVEAGRSAAKLLPDDSALRQIFIQSLIKAGRKDEARATLDAFVATHADQADAFSELKKQLGP